MSRPKVARPLTILLVALAAGKFCAAQQQTAELTGTITDSSGAVIAGATVTITNAARGISVVVTSDARGNYSAPLLPPADGYR